jgi:enoyl reductase-like protein
MTNAEEILKEHVTLDIECIDRMYLNGYIPNLQVPGQLVKFMRHRGYDIPSPSILGKWTDEYKKAVKSFAQEQGIEVVHFERGVRKEDVAACHQKNTRLLSHQSGSRRCQSQFARLLH